MYVTLALKSVMRNDGDFVDVILIYMYVCMCVSVCMTTCFVIFIVQLARDPLTV